MRPYKSNHDNDMKIAVVIPCFKVRKHIVDVVRAVGPEVCNIYLVDDACPEDSGKYATSMVSDVRLHLIALPSNQGVGGAVMSGYAAAISDGMDVIVKIDGDGQMDPALVPRLILPLVLGQADYAKGNRFFDLDDLRMMPKIRLFGNAILSFMTKFSSGYWNIFDPTNGFTAIHAESAKKLPFQKISKRYFFETDILFRLNLIRAVVVDVPMQSVYGDEVSNLRISKILPEFLLKHLRNSFKRIFYSYYLRDMSVASLELPIGGILFLFGFFYGLANWMISASHDVPTANGTIVLSAFMMLMGLQLLLAFLAYDISQVPNKPLQIMSLRVAKKQ